MRYTRTALGLLTRQYRSVLRKCWMINVGLFALGAASVMSPNTAEASAVDDYVKPADYTEVNTRLGNMTGNINKVLYRNIDNTSSNYIGGVIHNTTNSGYYITADFVNNDIIRGDTAKHGAAIAQIIQNTNNLSYSIGNITGKFVGNFIQGKSRAFGVAIANRVGYDWGDYSDTSNSSVTIGNISGDFIENYNSGNDDVARGGAIYNGVRTAGTATIGDINANFLRNHIESVGQNYGGAIANEKFHGVTDERVTIRSISGTFDGNNATSTGSGNTYGGAIFNSGTITNGVKGTFTGNYTQSAGKAYGGAIWNNRTIGGIGTSSSKATFSNNYASSTGQTRGGAIYNEGTINNIYADFTGNYLAGGSDIKRGGAISQYTDTAGNTISLGNITGNFTSNYVESTGQARGGAIFSQVDNQATSSALIGNITGNFTENYAKGTNAAWGGAIGNALWKNGTNTIENISGNFTRNHVESNTNAWGGAILNYHEDHSTADTYNIYIKSISGTFDGNYAQGNGSSTARGGAIYNSGANITNGISNSTFKNNYATTSTNNAFGGAIYNSGANITNGISNSTFKNNYATAPSNAARGGAIYNEIGSIGNISGSFTGNHLAGGRWTDGGAIFNIASSANTTATIGNISASFSGNYAIQTDIGAGDYAARGGAIYTAGEGSNTASASIGNISGNFSDNYVESSGTAASEGGAILNHVYSNGISTIGNITGNFTTNHAKSTGSGAAYGGAIAQSIASGGTLSINSISGNTFDGNYAQTTGSGAASGGAIYNAGTITNGISNVTFKNNYAESGGAAYGGAVYIRNTSTKFTSSSFTNNHAKSTGTGGAEGGALYLSATALGTEANHDGLVANFSGNYAQSGGATNGGGGAIRLLWSSIWGITGNFTNNYVQSASGAADGGAIMNQVSNDGIGTWRIGQIDGYFSGNYARSTYGTARGGAIYQDARGESARLWIGNISGDFTENFARADGAISGGPLGSAWGGAIYNKATHGSTADFYALTSNFTGNYALSVYGNAYGGAIVNISTVDDEIAGGTAAIAGISGNTFDGNYASGKTGAYGGAIYQMLDSTSTAAQITNGISNSTFKNNYATSSGGTAQGGAIWNNGSLGALTNVTFKDNTAGTTGGAIYNNGGTFSITGSGSFTGNKATSGTGGAIYNEGATISISATSGNITFTSNTAGTTAGAIDNVNGTITVSATDGDVIFDSNSNSGSNQDGGAIRINGSSASMSLSATGSRYVTLQNNVANNGTDGGAIGIISGGQLTIGDRVKFIGNSAINGPNPMGGAIFVNTNSSITSVGSSGSKTLFSGNYAKGASDSEGGAIWTRSTIGNVYADFTGNYAQATSGTYAAHGGALGLQNNNASVGTIAGTFSNNYAKAVNGAAFGGAIYTGGGTVGAVSGSFSGNYAESTGDGGALGGAIYNLYTIASIGTAGMQYSFAGNYAKSTSGEALGGAIYNTGAITNGIINVLFNGNYAKSTNSYGRGGAIYNEIGTLNLVDSNFTNNYISGGSGYSHGGAIWNSNGGTISITAQNSNVLFDNNYNTTSSGSWYYDDIYSNNATLSLNAASGKSITFGGSIYGSLGDGSTNYMNINTGSIYGGTYNFGNGISEQNITLGSSTHSAIVNLVSYSQDNGTTTYGGIYNSYLTNNAAGSKIGMANSHIDSNSLTSLTLNQNLNIGMDIKTDNTSDSFAVTAASGSGKMVIDEINEMDSFDKRGKYTYTYNVITGDAANDVTLDLSDALKAGVNVKNGVSADMSWTDEANWLTKSYSVDGPVLTYERNYIDDALNLINTETAYSTKTFTAPSATTVYTSTTDAGDTKHALTVTGVIENGNRSEIDLNDHNGFTLNDADSNLTLQNLKISGADSYTAQLNNADAVLNIRNTVVDGAGITNTAGNLNIFNSNILVPIVNSGVMYSDPTVYEAHIDNLAPGSFTTEGDIFQNITNGAITNTGTLTIREGLLKNNSITGDGGAINNSSSEDMTITDTVFKNNRSTGNGGAIYAGGTGTGMQSLVNTNFIGNNTASGQHGGAIYANHDLLMQADDGEVTKIAGNYVGSASNNEAIYMDSGNLSLRTYKGSTLRIDDKINGSGYQLLISGDGTGAVNFNDTVSNAIVNMNSGGVAKLGRDNVFDGNTLYMSGGMLDMRNGATGTMTLNTLNRSTASSLAIDAGLNSVLADNITATTHDAGTNKITISDIRLVDTDYSNAVDKVAVNVTTDAGLKNNIQLADNILSHIDGAMNYYTDVTYDAYNGDIVFNNKLINMSELAEQLNAVSSSGTGISYDATTGGLAVTDKLVSQSTLDAALKIASGPSVLEPTRGADAAVKFVETNASDADAFAKIDDAGVTKYYKAVGLRASDDRETNLSQSITDGYYEGQESDDVNYGGALTVSSGTIGEITADFTRNKNTNGNAGAVRNTGTITALTGDFSGNIANGGGGAILNENGTITTLTGNFYGNRASDYGGAIYGYYGNIVDLTGNFVNNSSTSEGGALMNYLGDITNLRANFSGNRSYRGGALSHEGTIYTLVGDFINNSATDYGGAIYNRGDGSSYIYSLTGDFIGNSSDTQGGAIYNGSYNYLGLIAKDKNITFYNNTDSTGYNDIQNNGDLNISAAVGKSVSFGGTVRGGEIYLNQGVYDPSEDEYVTTGNINGQYRFNNEISDDNVYLYNGANVKMGAIEQADGTTTYGRFTNVNLKNDTSGGTLDTQNGNIDYNQFGELTLDSDLSLAIDAELTGDGGSADQFVYTTMTSNPSEDPSKLMINSINLLDSSYAKRASIQVTNENNENVEVSENILENVTGAMNYHTQIGYDAATGSLIFHDKLMNTSGVAAELNAATGLSDFATYDETTGGINYSASLLTTASLDENYYNKQKIDSLSPKGDDSAGLVHQDGAETITGVKTFRVDEVVVDPGDDTTTTTRYTNEVSGNTITMKSVEMVHEDPEDPESPLVPDATTEKETIKLDGNLGDASFARNLEVGGDSTIGGNLGVDGNTSLTGTLRVTGATTLGSTLDVTGLTTLSGTEGLKFNNGTAVAKSIVTSISGESENALVTESAVKGYVGSGKLTITVNGNASTEFSANASEDMNIDLGNVVTSVEEGTTAGAILVNGTTSVAVHGLADVAKSGSYADLSNTPTIGTAALTITAGGTPTEFSANATEAVALNLDGVYYTKDQVNDLNDVASGSAGLVHRAGAEEIGGNKTFTGTNAFNGTTNFGGASVVNFNNGATVATGKTITFADGGSINKVLTSKVEDSGDSSVVSATALLANLSDYYTKSETTPTDGVRVLSTWSPAQNLNSLDTNIGEWSGGHYIAANSSATADPDDDHLTVGEALQALDTKLYSIDSTTGSALQNVTINGLGDASVGISKPTATTVNITAVADKGTTASGIYYRANVEEHPDVYNNDGKLITSGAVRDVLGDYYTKAEIDSTTEGAGLVHRSGIETIGGNKTFSDNVSIGGTLGVTGDSTLGGALGVSGKTTLSSAYGLSFGDETTVAKSIVDTITGSGTGSSNALVTEHAVKGYVGTGNYTLNINGSSAGTINVNDATGGTINLGNYVTVSQADADKGKVLYVNDSGNVVASKILNGMIQDGEITDAKLSSGVQTTLGLANSALQSGNVDDASIVYDTGISALKVGTITDNNIVDGSISVTKLGSVGSNNKLVVTDNSGKLTTSTITTDDLSVLNGLSDTLDGKLNKSGGEMSGDLSFVSGKGIKFGDSAAVTGVSNSIGETSSSTTLVTEQAVTGYVGNATIQLKVNGANIEGAAFTTNQSEGAVLDIGNFVEQQQNVTTAGGKVLTVNSETGQVEATKISNGMLEGDITKDKLASGIQTSLGLADSALQKADITTGTNNGTIKVKGTEVTVAGLGTAAYEASSAFAAADHGHYSSAISKMDGYTRTGTGLTGAITTSDSLNVAIAKLENGLGGKQDTLHAGDNITISGNTISATMASYSAAVNGGLSLNATTKEFSIANGGVTNDMLAGGIAQSKITNLTTDLASKLDTSVFNARTINNKALNEDVTLGGGDIAMTGYSKASSYSDITSGDTVNQAIGKLEKALEGQQTLTAGDNVTISNGRINAVDTTYTAAVGGGLALNETAFSIANGGVSNVHIAENAGIATDKLALSSGTASTALYYDASGNLQSGKLTSTQIADNAGIQKGQLATSVQNALTKAESALGTSDIGTGGTNGTIRVGTGEVAVAGLGTAAFTNSSAYAQASHTHTSQDVTLMTGYVKAATAGSIAATDSLNTAIGKLEKTLEGKQMKLTAGSGISINQETGEITATGSGGGAYYYAAANGGLSLNDSTHEFSIAENGVTNDMLQSGITKAKLADSVQQSLNKADSALQEGSIKEGDVDGAIKVGNSVVEVHGLASVATGGNLAADKVTQDASHKFVSDSQITSWTNKQDAISDLTTIRSNAADGKSAYDTVEANKASWDAKVSSVSAASGNADGKIALTVNGVTTQVAVTGLKSAAYREATEFASATHNHGADNITNMTGYSIATVSGAINTSDTLNQAIGKLEKGLSEKQNALVAGSNITINGNTINATDNDTKYTAAVDGGLVLTSNAFSIANGGVTNAMLEGNITASKLHSDIQASLNKANTALQKADITESTSKGKIKVGDKDVEVYGLASVATGGNLDASKVITDTTHQFVTDSQISDWNSKLDADTFNNRSVNGKKLNQNITLSGEDIALTNYVIADAATAVTSEDTVNSAIGKLEKGLSTKQGVIGDLATIRSNAESGADAYSTVLANKDAWDSKISSVVAATPTNNGNVAINVDGTKLELTVKGIGTAAYKSEDYYALSDHTHVASAINAMTGYEMASSAGSITTTDTLNQAIGKLEKGLSLKQGTLTAGDNITIDANGRISATGSGGAYTAAENGGLQLTGNAFSIADEGVTDNMLAGGISQSKIIGLTDDLSSKLNASVFNNRKINNKALNEDIVLGGSDIALTDYSKASEASAISANDTVNQAIGKLEKALEGQQTIQAGKHIEIVDGKINATYKAGTNIYIDDDGTIRAVGSAAAYTAKENGGLYLNPTNNEFSIAEKGVVKGMLAQDVQTSLGLADTALQKADIATGSTVGTISVDGTDVEVNGLDAVAKGGNLAASRVTEDTTHRFVSDTEKETWSGKVGTIASGTTTTTTAGSIGLDVDGTTIEVAVAGLGSAAFADSGTFALASHNHKSSDVTSLEGYAIASTVADITTNDTLNQALGKLEKGIKSNKLEAGTNVTIEDGKINAVDTKYSAAADGGLSMSSGNAFSIATGGVTNEMLAGGIEKGKLASAVQTSLSKADSAVQTIKVNNAALSKTDNTVNLTISEGSENGTISVNGSDVAVKNLADVAKGGNLAASKVTTDDAHQFVTGEQITSWSGKQDAISDLTTIRNNAASGKSAYDTVEANKTKWNNKVGSVSAASGDDFGKIALTVDNVTTQIAVTGLGTAASKDIGYFATSDHTHVASAINAMTGYTKEGYSGAIEATDTLNAAIAKLENGLGGKQGTLTAGTGITIEDNIISATGAGGTYNAGAGLELATATNTFSIADGGVTNAMLEGNIEKAKLAQEVTDLLDAADSALQAGDITSGSTAGTISVDGTDVEVYGLDAVAKGGNLAASRVTEDTTHRFVTDTEKETWSGKVGSITSGTTTTTTDGSIGLNVDGTTVEVAVAGLGSAAFADSDTFALASHNHKSSEVTSLTGYAIAGEASDLTTGDTLNQALGKLERGIKDSKLTAGTNVTISDGKINAVDTKYSAASTGGLSMDSNNAFSIKTGGVTNAMLEGNIAKGKLASAVQTSLGLADSALQADDITTGSTNGTIKVGDNNIAVKGLKSAAYAETSAFAASGHTHASSDVESLDGYSIATTAGALTTSDTLNEALGKLEKGVNDNKLTAGTNVTISDGKINAVDTKYSAAENGGLSMDANNAFSIASGGVTKSMLASGIQSSLDAADSALQDEDIINGTVNGTIKVGSRNVAVGGLGTAAYRSEDYFALASHNHVSSAINAMTGYEIATAASAITSGDTLNQAIGKLEYGLGTKQGTLTAGSGISIEGNIISATGAGGGTYYAGTGLALDTTSNTFSIASGGVSNTQISDTAAISTSKLALNSGTVNNVLYYNNDGVLTSGLLTSAQLATNAGILKTQLASEVQDALTTAESALTPDSITSGTTAGTIRVSPTKEVAVSGLGSAAFVDSDTFALASHTHASKAIDAMTDYEIASSSGAITATDTLNQAIGKLEKGLSEKQKTLIAGDNITIAEDGTISASGSGAAYHAGAGLELATSSNTFSIKTGGVTNAMLEGNIEKAKLASAVQTSLDAADSALQAGDITSGSTDGTISVNGTDVAVKNLADVATGGNLAASKVTTDETHKFVSDEQITSWSGKQDAISDLSEIRTNATSGKSAYDTVEANKTAWSNKVDSIATATGEGSDGKIAVTTNGVTTQIAVAGLKAGAFKDVDSTVTADSGNLVTSGAVKSYVSSIDSGSLHQAGAENITGTKTFKALQIFEKTIASGDDAGTYTTELDGDTLKLKKGSVTKITLDGKDGSATLAGMLTASGGVTTTTLVVNEGMTVSGASKFNDNVTIGSSTGTRNLTVNGDISATGKTTLSTSGGMSFGDGQEVTSIVNSIGSGSDNALKKQLVTAYAVKQADAALSERLDDVEAEVESHATTLSQHTSTLAEHTSQIAANTTAINNLGTTVAQHTSQIAANTSDIAANKTAIAEHTATLTEHTSQIAANTTAISGLDSRVVTLENTSHNIEGFVEALGGNFDTTTHEWSAQINPDKSVTYGTLDVTNLTEAVEKVYSHIGNGEKLDQIAQRQTPAANNGVSSSQSVNNNIAALNTTVGDLSKLNIKLKNLTNGGYEAPTTVVAALNNLDATLGTIHGLAAKRKSAGVYKGNLAEGTTVEMHLSALDDAIGDRTTISNEKGSHGYKFSSDTMYVADVLTDIASQIGTADQLKGAPNGVSKDNTVNQNIAAVSKAVGNVADLKNTYLVSETTNLTDAVRVLDADMYKMSYVVDENRREINSLRRKLRGGMASLSAMSALAPNSRAEGNTQLSIGTGMYESSPAVAVGAFHWLTNNLMVNAGLAWGDADDAVYRMGLTYSF